MGELISIHQMPLVPGIRVPQDFYWILSDLAGMIYPPPDTPWQALWEAGFRHVICLTSTEPGYNPGPLALLHAVELEDLYHGQSPSDPVIERALIHDVVRAARVMLEKGEGVIVHCAGGTGRTGTVIGCLLREMGYSESEVLEHLDALHRLRGRPGWPEAEWQALIVKTFG